LGARKGLGELGARKGLGELGARKGVGELGARKGLGELGARKGLGMYEGMSLLIFSLKVLGRSRRRSGCGCSRSMHIRWWIDSGLSSCFTVGKFKFTEDLVEETDCVIIGAGAAGLFCAIQAAKRGRRVVVLDHANKAGKKILMSGGGRCNFTNLVVTPENYLGQNPHFHKSALASYTQWDFITWVESHGIAYHEKADGQLFCTHKAKDLLVGLLSDCAEAGADIRVKTPVTSVKQMPESQLFQVETSSGQLQAESLVVATGGLSIPTMGASPFAYRLAEQFSIPVLPVRAGLVPFTLDPIDLERLQVLAGVSLRAKLSAGNQDFSGDMLFTHRGLSGPAVLQVSSFWQGGSVLIDWLPGVDLLQAINKERALNGKMPLRKFLSACLPNRLVSVLLPEPLEALRLADLSNEQLNLLEGLLHSYQLKPSGTEGYRTAEVTLGGVDTDYLSSKTMQVKSMPSLYFIGEAVDVTGWLGGYNFQWAWSSGFVAGEHC
jgi:predicted Rossmann fold flavoprotein